MKMRKQKSYYKSDMQTASKNRKQWGKKIQFPDGTMYHRTLAGNLVRESSRKCDEANNIKNHGVRRRLAALGIATIK